MLYRAYEARRMLATPMYAASSLQAASLATLPEPLRDFASVRAARAVAQTVAALELTHRRPSFGIDSTTIDGEPTAVDEEKVVSTEFATLLRFAKPTVGYQPRVLVIPGLAGHFATLVRGTIRTLLPDHDVYVADWHNARDVPVEAGRFGLDEFIDHLIGFLEAIGPGTHLMAVCQPCVPALAAAAIMAEDENPAYPRSLTLMSGPVDARVSPGPVNEFASSRSFGSLERWLITTVPRPYRGAGRNVYPGFMQAMGFISLGPRRHLSAFVNLMRDIAQGADDDAARTTDFYDEYFAVLDIAAEFYLDTARVVFREHHLARGRMTWHGRRVDPAAITAPLLTIEAENDQLCPPGQTAAAHALCTGVPAGWQRHHLQAGVGHYGVFSGSRFEREIYPRIRQLVLESDAVEAQLNGVAS